MAFKKSALAKRAVIEFHKEVQSIAKIDIICVKILIQCKDSKKIPFDARKIKKKAGQYTAGLSFYIVVKSGVI